jgi:hypothetical protein
MRTSGRILLACSFLFGASVGTVAAQESPRAAPCRDLPCSVTVDWTRQGGIGSLTPDRRYGNPAQLEDRLKARLAERGYTLNASTDPNALVILLQPMINNAMCDQMAGTATDRSCRAVTEVRTRLQGPDHATDGVDLPSSIRNRCASDQAMSVDKLAVFVADFIIYAVDDKAQGGRRPVARC